MTYINKSLIQFCLILGLLALPLYPFIPILHSVPETLAPRSAVFDPLFPPHAARPRQIANDGIFDEITFDPRVQSRVPQCFPAFREFMDRALHSAHGFYNQNG